MAYIKNISPIHIGSGGTYENFLIHQGKRYDFDDLIRINFAQKKDRILDPNTLRKISSLGSNNNEAKSMIKQLLIPTPDVFQKIRPLYNVYLSVDPQKLNLKIIQECMKTMQKPVIPGSSLKGFLLNVLMFDLVANDPQVRAYLENIVNRIEIEAKKDNKELFKTFTYKNYQKIELNVLLDVSKHLIVRDAVAEDDSAIYYLGRLTKTGVLPQIAEFIDCDVPLLDDWLIVTDRKEDKDSEHIEVLMKKGLYQRMKRLKTDYVSMSKTYLKHILSIQRDYVKMRQQDRFLVIYHVLKQLDDIEKMIDEGHSIIHIGKYTNYYTKSMGLAFGLDFYKKYFRYVFRPERKASPLKLNSMNFVANPKNSDELDQLPGFAEIIW